MRAWKVPVGWGLCLLAVVLVSAPGFAGPSKRSGSTYARDPELKAFVDSMAQKHDLDPATLEGILSQARYQPRIIQAMTRSTEPITWDAYRAMFVNPERVQGGVRFWNAYGESLAKAGRDFGVPEELIVAIIGIETQYGKNTGSFRVLDALATLAFDYPPRANTFRAELEHYLLLTREESIGPLKAKGSYAGAMGIAQFMPGSYRNYAVDFDGDGRRDLFRNFADAVGSVANYLSRHGWRHNQPTVVRARVTGVHYETMLGAGLELLHPIEQWRWLGVTPVQQVGKGERAILFKLTTQQGPEYWLGLNNFYVITRYNRSAYYAMAVHELGREIRSNRAEKIVTSPAPDR